MDSPAVASCTIEEVVEQVLRCDEQPAAKAAMLQKHLTAARPDQQVDLVAAVAVRMDLAGASGVPCLVACFKAAPLALKQMLLRGDPLAAMLRGAGSRAAAVADLAAMVMKDLAAQELALAAAGLWLGLARLEGVGGNWEALPPSPSRAAAVRLWAKIPAFAPPGIPEPGASAGPLVRWLAQPAGAAVPAPLVKSEKAMLLNCSRHLWAVQQNGSGVPPGAHVEDVLAALLHGMPEHRGTAAWYARVSSNACGHAASPWVCPLLAVIALQVEAAAGQLLQAPAGRPALLYAWVAAYGAILSVLREPSHQADVPEIGTCVVTILQMLSTLCEILSRGQAWKELVSTLLCITLHWPVPSGAGEHSGIEATVLPAWLAFARRCLLHVPDLDPGSPMDRLLPLVLGALPGHSHTDDAAEATGRAPADQLAQELRDRAEEAGADVARLGAPRVGLRNLGNTCYLNSVVQALALTEGLAADLLGAAPTQPLAREAAVRESFAKVVAWLMVASEAVRPQEFVELSPFGKTGRQQDATELARWLLEQLGGTDQRGSLTEAHFGGRGRTLVWCTACAHSHERPEAFFDLSLPVNEAAVVAAKGADAAGAEDTPEAAAGRIAVADLLRLYMIDEFLPGYRCDRCGATDRSRKRWEVTRPPEHLVLALSRFAYTAEGGQRKIDAHITLDDPLDLPVADPDGGTASAAYSLYAVVTHAGATPHSGHYVCLGRSSGEPGGQWRCYDDAMVRDLSRDSLQARWNGAATAYMLFYRRRGAGGEAARPPSRLRLPPSFLAEHALRELFDTEPAVKDGGRVTPFPMPGTGGPGPGGDGGTGDGMGGAGGLGGGGWVC